jgi:hypothetical protein
MAETVQQRKCQAREEKLAELARSLGESWQAWSLLDHEKLEIAKRGGELLAGVKALVGHGAWLAWVRKHLPQMDVRTAQNWRRIWLNWNKIEERARANAKSISHLGIVDALDLIREPKPKRIADAKFNRSERVPEPKGETEGSADARPTERIADSNKSAQSGDSQREMGNPIRSLSGAAQILEPTSGQQTCEPARGLCGAAQPTRLAHELSVCVGGRVSTCLSAEELIDRLKKGDLKLPIAVAIADKDDKEVGQFRDLCWQVRTAAPLRHKVSGNGLAGNRQVLR